jgi:predicted nucleic acid-binding protein
VSRVVPASQFEWYLKELPSPPQGCFVDTNLLFAADYEVHRLYDEAVELGEALLLHRIPIFSNATIRSELLELKRRVLIGEALLDFLEMGQKHLPVRVVNALRSLKTSIRESIATGSHYLLSDRQIKKSRDLFESEIGPGTWKDFCSKFIGDKLESEWERQVERKGINYLDGRPSEYLTSPIEWSDAIRLIETFGIGTSDAMILNIFLKSVFPFIVTAIGSWLAPDPCPVSQGVVF